MILTIISLLIFVVYLACVLKYIGHVPQSLSETYYLIGGKPFNRLRASLFTFMMWTVAFMLLPAMLNVTPGNMQFLAFLALTGICFVGAAPEFYEEFQGRIHTASAVIAAVFGLAWAMFAGNGLGWVALVLSLFGAMAGAISTKSIKSCRIFWLEMIAFATVYLTMILNLM